MKAGIIINDARLVFNSIPFLNPSQIHRFWVQLQQCPSVLFNSRSNFNSFFFLTHFMMILRVVHTIKHIKLNPLGVPWFSLVVKISSTK